MDNKENYKRAEYFWDINPCLLFSYMFFSISFLPNQEVRAVWNCFIASRSHVPVPNAEMHIILCGFCFPKFLLSHKGLRRERNWWRKVRSKEKLPFDEYGEVCEPSHGEQQLWPCSLAKLKWKATSRSL